MTKTFEFYDVNDWLYDEYSETIEVPLIKPNSSSFFSKKYISRQQELRYIIELASQEEKIQTIENRDSIYHIIAKLSRIDFNQKEKNKNNYSQLVRLSLGKQLFNYIKSDFFPTKNSLDYYLARFYSCVVLRKVAEANNIYTEIDEHLENIICRRIAPNSQIIGNIRCLYHLLSQKKRPDEILDENLSLIDMSKDLKHDAICSILLLNRSRLFRSLKRYELAEEALHQSYKIIRRNKLWKQSLYYILQLSLINQEKDQFVNLCLDPNVSQQIHHDCFGWRLTKILTGKDCYAYGFYVIPQKIKDILSSDTLLEEKYKSIRSIGQRDIHSV